MRAADVRRFTDEPTIAARGNVPSKLPERAVRLCGPPSVDDGVHSLAFARVEVWRRGGVEYAFSAAGSERALPGLADSLTGRGTYVKIKYLGGVTMWKLNKL